MKYTFKMIDPVRGTEYKISKDKTEWGSPDTLGELRAMFYDFCAALGYQVQTELFDGTQEINGTLKDVE